MRPSEKEWVLHGIVTNLFHIFRSLLPSRDIAFGYTRNRKRLDTAVESSTTKPDSHATSGLPSPRGLIQEVSIHHSSPSAWVRRIARAGHGSSLPPLRPFSCCLLSVFVGFVRLHRNTNNLVAIPLRVTCCGLFRRSLPA